MISGWVLLSVIRNYTYPRDLFRELLPIYGVVVRLQEFLIWAIVSAVLIVTIWAIVRLAHWIVVRAS